MFGDFSAPMLHLYQLPGTSSIRPAVAFRVRGPRSLLIFISAPRERLSIGLLNNPGDGRILSF
jgi:hypothetical protein